MNCKLGGRGVAIGINLSTLGLFLVALLWTLSRMAAALDEEDLDHFFMWTCIASVIAGLPSQL